MPLRSKTRAEKLRAQVGSIRATISKLLIFLIRIFKKAGQWEPSYTFLGVLLVGVKIPLQQKVGRFSDSSDKKKRLAHSTISSSKLLALEKTHRTEPPTHSRTIVRGGSHCFFFLQSEKARRYCSLFMAIEQALEHMLIFSSDIRVAQSERRTDVRKEVTLGRPKRGGGANYQTFHLKREVCATCHTHFCIFEASIVAALTVSRPSLLVTRLF